MLNTKKILLTAAAVGLVGLSAGYAHATDQDVQATLDAAAAVSLTLNTDMDFGSVDYTAGAHSGTVDLGSNGTPVLGGASAGLVLNTAGATAGSITVNSTSGTVDISCETGGTLDDGGGNQLTLGSVGFDINTGAAFGAIANTCAGLGTSPFAVNTGTTANPNILIGGQVTIGANALDAGGTATYATSTGGDPVTFRVVFQ